MWIGHPNHPVEPGMSWYYLVQCAYNVDALISLLTLSFTIEPVNPLAYSSALEFLEREHVVDENQRKQQVLKMMVSSRDQTVLWTPFFQVKWSPTRRGDFREMMVHHIVTNMLIFFSSYYRFTRVGSMIFLIHDLSDVPIDMSKLANFVKWKATTGRCGCGLRTAKQFTNFRISKPATSSDVLRRHGPDVDRHAARDIPLRDMQERRHGELLAHG